MSTWQLTFLQPAHACMYTHTPSHTHVYTSPVNNVLSLSHAYIQHTHVCMNVESLCFFHEAYGRSRERKGEETTQVCKRLVEEQDNSVLKDPF